MHMAIIIVICSQNYNFDTVLCPYHTGKYSQASIWRDSDGYVGFIRWFFPFPFWGSQNWVPSTQILPAELQSPCKDSIAAHLTYIHIHVEAYRTSSWASLWGGKWKIKRDFRLLLWYPTPRITSAFIADGCCSWTGTQYVKWYTCKINVDILTYQLCIYVLVCSVTL